MTNRRRIDRLNDIQLVLDYLRAHPGSLRKQIVAGTGLYSQRVAIALGSLGNKLFAWDGYYSVVGWWRCNHFSEQTPITAYNIAMTTQSCDDDMTQEG